MPVATDAQVAAIPGWFQDYDVDLFRLCLESTHAQLGTGDLAELGVYLGKSASLIGSYLHPGETLTVVDLFGAPAETGVNAEENDDQYSGLDRAAFERHYLSVNSELPQVVAGLSRTVVDHAEHGKHRFVHIDASHLYEHVVEDIDAAEVLLAPDGIVVLDDVRSEHTPGVAAAAWGAVASGRLRPFAISPVKLYATFGDPRPWYDAVAAWVATSRWSSETQVIAGHPVLRAWWSPERTDATATSRPAFAKRVARRALGR